MIGHQVVFVYRLNSGGECFPYLRLDVALDVATHEPDDVGLVLIAVGEEGAIFLGILDGELAVLHQSAPDAHHADVDAVVGCAVDDVIHVVPIAVDPLLVDVLEIPSVDVRHLSVDVIGGNTVDGLHLYDIIAGFRTALQIPFCLSTVKTFRQQPASLAQPEEGLSVLKLQITLVIRNTQLAVVPRLACLCRHRQQRKAQYHQKLLHSLSFILYKKD